MPGDLRIFPRSVLPKSTQARPLARPAPGSGARAPQREHATQWEVLHPRSRLHLHKGTAPTKFSSVVSARFGADKVLAEIAQGKRTLAKDAEGLEVTKLQQALVDMGFPLPVDAVSGVFCAQTEHALQAFQRGANIEPASGILDAATLAAMQSTFDTRKPYLSNATFDPFNPGQGLRDLTDVERKAAWDALVPVNQVEEAKAFQEIVKGKTYGEGITERLTQIGEKEHKSLYADKLALRTDPDKNLHSWGVLERVAAIAKEVTDAVYGTHARGAALSHEAGTLVDLWEARKQRIDGLSSRDRKEMARELVKYLLVSCASDIDEVHSAVHSNEREQAILKPIIESFVDTEEKVQKLLEIDMGWPAVQRAGVVFLQRYKASDGDNAKQLWELLQACVHEYLHTLVHPYFFMECWRLGVEGDRARDNTLREGFCDFLTENVLASLEITEELRKKVEGAFYDENKPFPTVNASNRYESRTQAEHAVGICGIRNAEAAYFHGDLKRIGRSY